MQGTFSSLYSFSREMLPMKTIKRFFTSSFLFATAISLLAILVLSAQPFAQLKYQKAIPVLNSNPAPGPKHADAQPVPSEPSPCPKPNAPELTVFSAKWCGACQRAKPIVSQIERLGVKVIRVDADEQPQLLKENNVRSLPTFIAVKDGKTLRTQDVNKVLEFLK
jgi:thiol-disulfide isomerase/thioredoxin